MNAEGTKEYDWFSNRHIKKGILSMLKTSNLFVMVVQIISTEPTTSVKYLDLN